MFVNILSFLLILFHVFFVQDLSNIIFLNAIKGTKPLYSSKVPCKFFVCV